MASAAEFVAQVLRLQPRAAAFDCDGTLWAADSGEVFFYWKIEQGLIPPEVARWALPRYADYKQGRLSEEQNCIDSIVIHRGLAVETIGRAAARFVQEYVLPDVFPEMRELLQRLHERGCAVWVVSSTNEWVVEAAVAALGVEKGRVIATAVRVEDGRASDVLGPRSHRPRQSRRSPRRIRRHSRRRLRQFHPRPGNAHPGGARLRRQSHARPSAGGIRARLDSLRSGAFLNSRVSGLIRKPLPW